MLRSMLSYVIITMLLFAACSGGWDTESPIADELAPAIFGKDTLR